MRELMSASVARIGAPAFARLYRFDSSLRRKLMPAGWLLGALAFVAAILGLNTRESLIYQVFGLAVGLLAIATLASLRFNVRANVTRALPQVATVGAPFEYTITITNLGERSHEPVIVEEALDGRRPTAREFIAFKVREDRTRNVFDRLVGYPRFVHLMRLKFGAHIPTARLEQLPAKQSTTVLMTCTPLRRGELRFESLTLGRPEPLGLMKALRRFKLRESLIVMPRTYPVAPLTLPGNRRLQPGGVAFAGHIGDAEEFVSLRDYRSGDTPRRIHWKAWARTGRLVIKEYQDEFFVRHALLLDTFPPRDSFGFEAAVSLAASLVMMPRSSESLLDLMFVENRSYTFTQGRGLGAPAELLRVLATVEPSGGKFSDLAEAAILGARRMSGGICVLLAWDEARRSLVASLRGMGIPLRVWVIDDSGATLDPGPMASDPNNFRVVKPESLEQELARP
ncbi:MAG: DUF58 domain-containing protein [Burkholderiales bacterium]|nr:DUF58 domain-containing protein [Burkholderiales bacterium]